MCGIAGYIGPKKLEKSVLDRCFSRMKRRGPDASGLFQEEISVDRHVALLHSRLAILDLDQRSNQPYEVSGGVLAFNGEIYNYRELRARIEQRGVALHTSGDTEVLALVLDADGWEGLSDCEGMWAAAWLDRRSGDLLLARDRFGEKPLLVFRDREGGIFFGSEVSFIEALLGQRLKPNVDHVRRLLVNGYKSLYKTKETFFHGLEEVPAGSALRILPTGRTVAFRWWDPRFGGEAEMSFDEAVRGTRERLIRSLELRLRSDVPVAFHLSGGVDSNALISIATHELQANVHGFTVMNRDRRYEEAAMVETAVRHLGIRHTAVELETPDFIDRLNEQVCSRGFPVLTINSFASWELSKEISANGYKVAISGIGADELFSGYYDHHNAYLAEMYWASRSRYESAKSEWFENAAKFVRNPFLQDPDYFIKNPVGRGHIFLDATEFKNCMRKPFFEPFEEAEFTSPLLRNRMANELFVEAVPVVLHEDDLNSMFYSIENRSPFLDTELFDWAYSIPTEHLVKKGLAKAVLRSSVMDLAPHEVIMNPRKVGFNVAFDSLIDRHSVSAREALLSPSPIFDVVRIESIRRMIEQEFLSDSQNKFIFSFLSCKLFLEEWSA